MVESRYGILCSECNYKLRSEYEGCTDIENPFWGKCDVSI